MTRASTGIYKVRTDGRSTGPKGRYLLWYSDRSGGSKVEQCESLQKALDTSWGKENSERCTIHSIEGPAGAVTSTEMQDWLDAKARESAADRRRWFDDRQGQPIYYVQVRSLDEIEGIYEIVDDEREALRTARELKLPGRVKVFSIIDGGVDEPENENLHVIKDWND